MLTIMRKLMTWVLKLTTKKTMKKNSTMSASQMQNRIDAKITLELQKFIEEKLYREDMDLAATAEHLGVSPQQLSFYFKHVMGKPYTQWRKEMRIEDAKGLLMEPDLSISEIAGLVGIPDKSNFRRRFADVTGCTPKEWRRMQLNRREA